MRQEEEDEADRRAPPGSERGEKGDAKRAGARRWAGEGKKAGPTRSLGRGRKREKEKEEMGRLG